MQNLFFLSLSLMGYLDITQLGDDVLIKPVVSRLAQMHVQGNIRIALFFTAQTERAEAR